jgi:hypothetical protein
MPQLRATKVILIIAFLIGILLSACSVRGNKLTPAATPEGALPVDPLFRDFYDNLGGNNILGPVISPLFALGNRKYQYTQNALMEYDLEAAPSERYRLANLGLDMGITEPTEANPNQPGVTYVDGHIIFGPFVQLYNRLGGSRVVGKPLTDVHFNPEKQRFEQYFENVGFYWFETEPQDAVYLLAYGAWKCDKHCRVPPSSPSIIELFKIIGNPNDDLFTDTVARLGSDFTGFALTDAFTAQDGKIEKIYENVVLVANPANDYQVSLRPMPEMVGVLVQPPIPSSGTKGMVFYPKQGDLGYDIPQDFLDYIMAHGGIETFGPPITGLVLTTEQVFRQCFTYVCLDYHLNSTLPEPLRIRPAPLGFPYKDLFSINPEKGNGNIQVPLERAIAIQIYAKYELILSSQAQEISAVISMGDKPLRGFEPILVVFYPDGHQGNYYFPATGEDGKTTIVLDPIPAQNGTLVPYEVCLSTASKDLFCVKESFVIWGNP